MNKDQIKGRVDEAVGKGKQIIGGSTGDVEQHDEGVGQELKGKVQKGFGDLKNKIGKAIDK